MRAIGYGSDKDILIISWSSEEIKADRPFEPLVSRRWQQGF
jgi:hypothetical protein